MGILVVGATGTVVEAGVFGDYFLGHETVPADRVAKAYVKSVEGRQTGQACSVL
jgi:hypothetical protein